MRVRRALIELENRDSSFPSSSRVNALKLVQIFKIQYNRSADKFVSSMLAQKNRKVIRFKYELTDVRISNTIFY